MPRKDYIPTYINGKELAQLSGNSPAFITQSRQKGVFAAKGLLRRRKGSGLYTYHRDRCLEVLQHLDPAKKRKGQGNGLYSEERGKLIRAQRKRIEFKQKINEGEYLPRAEAERLMFTIGRQLRTDLQNIPARLSAMVAAKSKKKEQEIYQMLYREIDRILFDTLAALKKIVEHEHE